MPTDQQRVAGRRLRRRARAECRENRHRYGAAQEIGGGILRRVCAVCGAVSIDLTAADEPAEVGLFGTRAEIPADS